MCAGVCVFAWLLGIWLIRAFPNRPTAVDICCFCLPSIHSPFFWWQHFKFPLKIYTLHNVYGLCMLFSQDLLLSYGWWVGPRALTGQLACPLSNWTFYEWYKGRLCLAEFHVNNYCIDIVSYTCNFDSQNLPSPTWPGYSAFSSVQNSIFFYLFI